MLCRQHITPPRVYQYITRSRPPPSPRPRTRLCTRSALHAQPFSTSAPRTASTSSMNQAVSTDKAPPVAGPYSQAVLAPPTKTGILYISGQLPSKPDGTLLTDEPLSTQARACVANVLAVLNAAHSAASLKNIVKTTVFLTTMDNFNEVNKGYEEAFGSFGNWRPARSCVAVRELPKGVQVEIEAIAHV